MEETLLSISETAKLLGVCENTLRDWDIEGKFKAQRTVGNHRRYSLDNIRTYLDKNQTIPKEKKHAYEVSKEVDVVNELVVKWEKAGYLQDLSKKDKKVVAVLLDNQKLTSEISNSILSSNQQCWLVEQGFKRSKCLKLITTIPMLGPATLAHFSWTSENNSLIVDSVAVAARTKKLGLSLFVRGDFEVLKESYADALADDIDFIIFDILSKSSTRLSYEDSIRFMESYGNNEDFFIVGHETMIEHLKYSYPDAKLELITWNQISNENFQPLLLSGWKSKHLMQTPMFFPYVMLTEAVGNGSMKNILVRYGEFISKGYKNAE